ncbi:MAG: ComF family protein [Bacteroidaceae bacterium]|nr:ComF family protein [Bacteroidaceae bacterium]
MSRFGTPWISQLPDFFVPRRCVACGRSLDFEEFALCYECAQQLPFLPLDNFIDNRMARLLWPDICPERAAAFFQYSKSGVIHDLTMALKYQSQPLLGIDLGRMMAHALQPKGFFDGIDALVPVPLHWKRKWDRGYNQSKQLARGISEVTGIPIDDTSVCRVRDNETQTAKSVEERQDNTRDLFEGKEFPHQHILLIDDVITTGATLKACAIAIRQANPETLISLLTLNKA